jgi:hypothetical protein
MRQPPVRNAASVLSVHDPTTRNVQYTRFARREPRSDGRASLPRQGRRLTQGAMKIISKRQKGVPSTRNLQIDFDIGSPLLY